MKVEQEAGDRMCCGGALTAWVGNICFRSFSVEISQTSICELPEKTAG